jgi:hypothetical protein
MIATNLKKLRILIVLCLFIMFSCSKKEDIKEKCTYEIISLLFDRLTINDFTAFPPTKFMREDTKIKNNVFSKEDSLRIIKFNEEWISKKRTIAIIPKFYEPTLEKFNVEFKCENYKVLLEKFISLNEEKQLVLSKINTNRKDSIIYFNNDMIQEDSKSYKGVNVLVGFSQISFDKDYNRAIISAYSYTSRIVGGSYIYFLERKEGEWIIICSETLSIS